MNGTAERVSSISRFGKSQDVVRCVCGHLNRFYRWSWAGHGKARCKGCEAWILYANLAVQKGAA